MLKKILPILMLLTIAGITSCDWEKLDRSPEPDHPMYVTYTISASSLEFAGPDELLEDIEAWIKTNQIAYDKKVSYKSGEASEFTKTDAEAVKKYEEFVPLFKAYLEEVKKKLAAGAYDELTSSGVSALFAVYAARTQGQLGNLKYDQIKFSYP